MPMRGLGLLCHQATHGILEYKLKKPLSYSTCSLHVQETLLDITNQQLQLARYLEEQTDVEEDDWSQGAIVYVVRRLADYWEDGYD